MPPIETPWDTDFPTSQDTIITPGSNQPDLTDDSAPGASDGDRLRLSHLHALRDKLQDVALGLGDNSDLPTGCVKERVTDLEAAPPAHGTTTHQNGQSDEFSVAGLSGLLADDQNPVNHASDHQHTGVDEVATATPGANAIPKAGAGGTLAAGWVPDGADATAIHDDTAGEINAVGAKATPVAADVALIEDSADSWNKKKIALTDLLGGGFTAYEKEFPAAVGANQFDLTISPAVNANTLSGRNILGVFRNGIRSRYQATATLANEYDQTGGTDKINVVGQSGGEIFTVVFGV